MNGEINNEQLGWDIEIFYAIKLLIYSFNNIFLVNVVRDAHRSNSLEISVYEPQDTLPTSLISSMPLPEDFVQ